ncbi:MAG: lysophospholipid acyltransferase family protein [Planctomycetota bacterium]|nr:lysophospholipid acyltransferase family protein [Planctomycetota bacterium]
MAEPANPAASARPFWPVEPQLVEGEVTGWRASLEARAYVATLATLARLPRGFAEGFGAALAPLAKRLDRGHAASARELLHQALVEHAGREVPPAELERLVTVAYRHLFRVALDAERYDRRFGRAEDREGLRARCEVDLSPAAEAVIEALGAAPGSPVPGHWPAGLVPGRGCVLASAHCGDWEMAARISSAVGFRPLYIVSKPPANRPLSRIFQERREATGVRLLPRRGAMQFAKKVVEGGGALGMLLDQRARMRPVFAPFFGRRARCDRSAGVLLRRLDCPVVFVAAYRTGDLRWRFHARDVLLPADIAGQPPETVTALVNRHLEELILAEPEQYFWLHDRYRGAEAEA